MVTFSFAIGYTPAISSGANRIFLRLPLPIARLPPERDDRAVLMPPVIIRGNRTPRNRGKERHQVLRQVGQRRSEFAGKGRDLRTIHLPPDLLWGVPELPALVGLGCNCRHCWAHASHETTTPPNSEEAGWCQCSHWSAVPPLPVNPDTPRPVGADAPWQCGVEHLGSSLPAPRIPSLTGGSSTAGHRPFGFGPASQQGVRVDDYRVYCVAPLSEPVAQRIPRRLRTAPHVTGASATCCLPR